jgi:hypothetical protein
VWLATADFVHDAFQSHHLMAGGTPLVGMHDPNGAGAATVALLERKGFFTKQSLVRANICHADLVQYGIGVKEADAIATAVALARRRLRSRLRRMPADERCEMKRVELELATHEMAERQAIQQQQQRPQPQPQPQQTARDESTFATVTVHPSLR